MMLGGLGLESPGQHQLMLMMLWRLGLKRDLKAGPAPGDAHDARWFGGECPGQHQLMLMMLGGLGFESPGKHQMMLMMLGWLGS